MDEKNIKKYTCDGCKDKFVRLFISPDGFSRLCGMCYREYSKDLLGGNDTDSNES